MVKVTLALFVITVSFGAIIPMLWMTPYPLLWVKIPITTVLLAHCARAVLDVTGVGDEPKQANWE